jgi:hypothetical protein
MRVVLPLLTLAAVLVPAPAGRADEKAETQMEFVRRLRAKGYNDLALDYLQRLQKNPPPGIGPLLTLEEARTRLSLARDKEPGQRLEIFAQARAGLEKYLKANASRPEATQVRLEMARIATYEGEALLSRALASDDDKSRNALALKARQRFAQAATDLDAAAKASAKVLAATKGDSGAEQGLRKRLGTEVLQAELERGRAFLEEARTYLDTEKTADREARGKLVKEGETLLKKVALDKKVTSPATSYLALAWLIKAAYDQTDPDSAHNYYKQVMAATGPETLPARRLAKLLWIQHIAQDKTLAGTSPEKLRQLTVREAQGWLAAYPAFRNTPEGQAVRFELAYAYRAQALALSKDLKTPESRKLADRAHKIFADLATSDSDYSRAAKRLDVQIMLKRMGENTPVGRLKTFDECSLKAQYELAMAEKAADEARAKPAEAAKLGQQRRTHLNAVVAALERGLKLATPKSPPRQVQEARFLLTVAYLLTGDTASAARQGERLAREPEGSKWSAPGAGIALQAYANALARDPADDAARKSLHDLAGYVLAKKDVWKDEAVVPFARYQLALLAIREHEHRKAFDYLTGLPPDFPAYVFAQCQAAFEALNVVKSDSPTDADKEAWKKKAVDVLDRVSKLPANADPATVQMFFSAQIFVKGNLLYEQGRNLAREGKPKEAAARYADMVRFVDGLAAQFAKVEHVLKEQAPPAPKKGKEAEEPAGPRVSARQEIRQALDRLKTYGLLGAADLAYRAGGQDKAGYDKVLSKELAGGVLAQVEAQGKGGGPIRVADPEMTGEILSLALRAQVQKGDVKGAQKTLGLIQRLTGPGGENPNPTAPLRSLLGELQAQMRDLKAKKQEDRLKQTVATFSTFFKAVADQGGKGLTRNDIIFLANCYNTLGEYKEAAGLYGKVQPPKAPPMLDPAKAGDEKAKEAAEKAKQDYERERQAYWLMQCLYGAALRKSGQLDEATKVLNRVLKTKGAAGQVVALKEKIHILEERARARPDLWGNAINEWNKFLQSPEVTGRARQDKEGKKVYFESYFHLASCWYEYSQGPKLKGTPRGDKALQRAADYLVRLKRARNQEGWRIIAALANELLNRAPALKQAFDTLLKKRL